MKHSMPPTSTSYKAIAESSAPLQGMIDELRGQEQGRHREINHLSALKWPLLLFNDAALSDSF